MKLPNKFLFTQERKEMWKDAKPIIKKIDKALGLKEVYAIGSFVSKKKRPADIDFAIVTKLKNKNSSYPIDLVILPSNTDTKEYLEDIEKWIKQRYGKGTGMVKLK